MVTIKLHGFRGSTCTNRVVLTCNEIGIDYELIQVDLVKGEHQQSQYLDNIQPFGVVPVLEEDDGTKYYESRAICRYLVAKYGKDSGLMPDVSDLRAYGLFEQAASVEYAAFDPSAHRLGKERVVHKMMGIPANEALADSAEEILKLKLQGYERVLSKQKYLAGDRFTLADLFHIPPGVNLDRYDPNIMRANPNVKRWWEDISSRESCKKMLSPVF
ncbi:hypothetical protein FRC09_004436 [Ceratobasidium sp. 395]|nr:hypothetical protein FRC09_004436 [Ceratobasidium sp. 395]